MVFDKYDFSKKKTKKYKLYLSNNISTKKKLHLVDMANKKYTEKSHI